MTLNDEHEATIIESLLKAEKIMVLRRYRDIGEYLKIYMGTSNLGVDLFVPQESYAHALEIINSTYPSEEGLELEQLKPDSAEGSGVQISKDQMGGEYEGRNDEDVNQREEQEGSNSKIMVAVIAMSLALLYIFYQLIGKTH